MKRILFTPVAGPFGALDVVYDVAQDRLTKEQDIFTQTSHNHCEALHFLAQNLESTCTVLEFPTLDEFLEELKRGYEYVGINFTILNIPGCMKMVEAIKKNFPETKIILGGYGTICFNTIFKGNDPLSSSVDHICHGEGVRFLRRILGEEVERPVLQPIAPMAGFSLPWLEPYPKGETGYVVSGLGCPNKCEFCCTSAYYHGEFIELAKADSMYEGAKAHIQSRPEMKNILVFDENLYKDKDKVYEFGRHIREDPELGLDRISFFGFGTNEDLSKYDLEELPTLGVGTIWIGVESMYSDLEKRQGRDIAETFSELHRIGILTIGSWIGGWDFHNKKTIQEDLESFIRLKPVESQLLPLTPVPGTALWEKNPSLILQMPKRYFGKADGTEYEENFTQLELWNIVESGHRRLYEHAGPTVMRGLRVHVNGVKFCSESKRKELNEKRIQLHRRMARELYPILKPAEFFAPNDKVREELKELRSDYISQMGEPTTRDNAKEAWVFQKAAREKMRRVVEKQHVSTPTYRRYEYSRKSVGIGEIPYSVSYPREDGAYNEWLKVKEREELLYEKFVDALERGEDYAKKMLADMDQAAIKLGEAAMAMQKIAPVAPGSSSLTQIFGAQAEQEAAC